MTSWISNLETNGNRLVAPVKGSGRTWVQVDALITTPGKSLISSTMAFKKNNLDGCSLVLFCSLP